MNRGSRIARQAAPQPTANWTARCLAALLFFALSGPAIAGDGWSMSSLNPFKKASTDKRARGNLTDAGKSGSFLSASRPSTRSYTTRQKEEPSTFEKMSQGTKSFFTKTKDTLTPWSKSSSKKKPSAPKSPSKKSFLSSWWPKKKEPPKPKTVGDFLAQDRPS